MMGFKRIRPVVTPDATLAVFYPAWGLHMRADKAFTPHPPAARCSGRMNACRVLSGQEDAHVGRIRRLRRIRQQLQIIAYGKNRYTTYTNARHSRRNLVRLAVRLSAGCNFPELVHRRLTLWRAGERIRQLQGIITITVTRHPFQTKPELIHPYAPTPVDISAKSRIG